MSNDNHRGARAPGFLFRPLAWSAGRSLGIALVPANLRPAKVLSSATLGPSCSVVDPTVSLSLARLLS
jgi:hypothetical protein